jgi:hypothetical protein
MRQTLTTNLDSEVYQYLKEKHKGEIGKFLESLIRPLMQKKLEKGYEALASQESDAKEWGEWENSTISDIPHETW